MSTLSDADFYVVSATVIPVVFLAIVLEGGLWAWLTDRIIKSNQDAKFLVRAFVSLLQAFGILVVVAATISEILALLVLLNQQSNSTIAHIVFLSTAFLIALLGAVLVSRIPGVWVVHQGELSLALEEGEELRWQGVCAKLGLRFYPWLWGKLFLTNRRLVWMAPAELGLLGSPTMRILTDTITRPEETKESFWYPLIRLLPANGLLVFFPPKGRFMSVRTNNRHVHYFCVSQDGSELFAALESLTPTTTSE